ncbi:MAG: hypothetical protein ACLSH6_08395 [Limosilactobacillus pontis]
MIRRHIVEIGLTVLFMMGVLIAFLMWWAGQYSITVSTAMMILILLGMAAGTFIPSILITWLIIGLTTIEYNFADGIHRDDNAPQTGLAAGLSDLCQLQCTQPLHSFRLGMDRP